MSAALAPGPVLPLSVAPMLAQAAEGPLDSSLYAYEVKWDGMRVVVGVEDGRLSLRTRNGIEAATRFPELAQLPGRLRAGRAVLDGEIVRLGPDGRPDFGCLQQRIQLGDPLLIERAAAREPAALILFDALRIDDEWLAPRPWEERRRRLEEVVQPTATIQLSPVWDNGQALWESVSALGMEGVMAKRRSARYEPGKRTPAWLKIKTSKTIEAVVGAWTEGTGVRSSTFGALALGWFLDGHLVYIGNVGTGFDQPCLRESSERLRPLETGECPFRPVPPLDARPHWVRPELVCEVKFLNWTGDGRLRFPVFVRWRPDRSAADCALSSASHAGG